MPTQMARAARRHPASRALPVLALVLAGAPAAAQFDLFQWTKLDQSGDSIMSVTDETLSVAANWPSQGGGVLAVFTAVAPVSGTVSATMTYFTFDGVCHASVPVFVLNGTPTILAVCSATVAQQIFVPQGATFGFGLQTFDGTWPGLVWWDDFDFEPIPAFDPWSDLGQGLAGAAGVPALQATSLLYPQSPFELVLEGAAPGAAAALVVGLSQLGAPFKGGVLVPSPDLIRPGIPTGTAGAVELDFTWPGGLPSGVAFYLQFWVPDPTGPAGFSASNALKAQVP
jgi:hypothetical protein